MTKGLISPSGLNSMTIRLSTFRFVNGIVHEHSPSPSAQIQQI